MGHDLELSSADAQQTRRIAAAVATYLQPGDVVALTGELGAGKTCFVQGAAAVLGVTERVTSPSFVLRRDYHGRVGVAHIDVYRLDSLREVVELGFDDVFDRHLVTFLEWGDAVRPLLPPDHLEVELRLAPEGAAPNLAPEGAERGLPSEGAELNLAPEEADGGAGQQLAEPARLLRICAHGGGWQERMGPLAADLSPWRVPDAAERAAGRHVGDRS